MYDLKKEFVFSRNSDEMIDNSPSGSSGGYSVLQ